MPKHELYMQASAVHASSHPESEASLLYFIFLESGQ